jgi:hypothetical protein
VAFPKDHPLNILIRTKSGDQSIDWGRIQGLHQAGKIPVGARAFSVDGGHTWLTYVDLEKQIAESKEADANAISLDDGEVLGHSGLSAAEQGLPVKPRAIPAGPRSTQTEAKTDKGVGLTQKPPVRSGSADQQDDDEADDALTDSISVIDSRRIVESWRTERISERKRFLNKWIRKIKTRDVSLTRRIPRFNSYGEPIDIGELINRVCELYREAGFTVEEGDHHVRVRYKGDGKGAIGVSVCTIVCIVFVRRPKSWQIVVRGELDYWTNKFDRLLTMGCFIVIICAIFWPCLLCLPLMFHVDEDKLKQSAEEHLLGPLMKMLEDFKVEGV